MTAEIHPLDRPDLHWSARALERAPQADYLEADVIARYVARNLRR